MEVSAPANSVAERSNRAITPGRGSVRPAGTRRFLIAAAVSTYGDWLTTVALVVLLYRLTGGSVLAPTLYMVVRVAPRVAGPAFGGLLGDRLGPARIAADCSIAQGAFSAAIVVLGLAHQIWPIYLCVAAAQFLNAFAQPSYAALLPQVTAPSRLGQVNGLYNALFASAMLVSPAVGALLLTHVAPETLIAADAATFVVAAGLLSTLRGIAPGSAVAQARSRAVTAGIPIVLRDRMLRAYAAGSWANAATVTALQAVLVIAASQRFGGDSQVGWLYAAVGAGGLIGAVVFLRRTPTSVGFRWVFLATLLELAPLAGFVFAPSLPVASVLLAISCLGGVLYQVAGSVGLQQRVPTHLLGRVNGVIRTATYAGMLFGALAALALVNPLGWQTTVLVVAALALVVILGGAAYHPNRRLARRRRAASATHS